MTLKKTLAFTVLVTLAMQALDAFYHIQFDITLHVPYMFVKVVVVGFTLFFLSYWTGIGLKRGLVLTLA